MLGDQAVERAARGREPALGLAGRERHRRERDPAPAVELPVRELFERGSPLGERTFDPGATRGVDEQIEHDVERRRLRRELPDAALGRMDALEQRVERDRGAGRHDELAVEHEATRVEGPEVLDHLGEVALQRLARLRLQLDVVAVAEGETAEAVPLGLVLPLAGDRQRGHGARLHRRERRMDRKRHRKLARSTRARDASSGFQRSPRSATRAGTVSIR